MTTASLPPELQAIHPGDPLGWLAIADHLEEHGDDLQAELIRLRLTLLTPQPDTTAEVRLRELLYTHKVKPLVATLTNSVGMEFCYVPAGVFLMGAPDGDPAGHANERPQHAVAITRGFWLGRYPVTQREYASVMGANPSHFKNADDSPRRPVETVSHHDAVAMARRLSETPEEAAAGRVYTLPTEARWEYACRGGTTTAYHFGEKLTHELANYHGGPGHTTPVGRYPGNAWGLHDMHGNVWEWCSDWYDPQAYRKRKEGLERMAREWEEERVLRGGSSEFNERHQRSSSRASARERSLWGDVGVRLAMPDPVGEDEGGERALRGGSHRSPPHGFATNCRVGNWPDEGYDMAGYRLAVADPEGRDGTPSGERSIRGSTYLSQPVNCHANNEMAANGWSAYPFLGFRLALSQGAA